MRSEIEWTASMELVRTNMTAAEPSIVATQLGASLMGIFLLLGLVGNLLIMVAIVTIRKVWNVINIFIISLVINDLLAFALIVVFIIHSYASHAWSAGDVMCKLNPELTLLFTGCSLWHTALIAIHRYIVVCHNSAYNRMSKTAYVAFVLVVARAIPMLCVFPGVTRPADRLGIAAFNSRALTHLDLVLSRLLRPNLRYHAVRWIHRFRPTAVFYVVERPAK